MPKNASFGRPFNEENERSKLVLEDQILLVQVVWQLEERDWSIWLKIGMILLDQMAF